MSKKLLYVALIMLALFCTTADDDYNERGSINPSIESIATHIYL